MLRLRLEPGIILESLVPCVDLFVFSRRENAALKEV